MATTYDAAQRLGKDTMLPSEGYVPKAMPAILGSLDMTTTYLMAIFFIVNAATAASGGPSAFTYLLLGGITFFIPSVIATAQLGHMFPHEGSLYNWTHRAFGGYWSFFIGFCAWFPGVLVIMAGADIVVSMVQGLNSNWLTEPWQQGIVLVVVVALSGVLAVQRLSMVKIIVNVVVSLIFLAVVIIGLAALVWLLQGHAPATNFSRFADWGISWNPQNSNINLFGLITLAYLGTEVPLNMGGEIRNRGVVTKHLLWGTVLVFVGYFIATLALLIVMGSQAGGIGGFSLVMTVDKGFGPGLGKFMGNITAVCIIAFFVLVPVVYNYAFARLLLVAGVDRRLPRGIGKLNKNRVPANAITFQTVVAIALSILIFMVAPYLIKLAKPADLATEVYNISQASATLVWAVSTGFLFINIVIFYLREPRRLKAQLVVPMPILIGCVIIGPLACLFAIVDTLFFSWISQISNSQWWYIIGGVTLACIIIAAVGSMFASSEATWQNTLEEER